MYSVQLAVIIGVGINTLQFVDMKSFRNAFVVGAALFFGVSVSSWVATHQVSLTKNIGNLNLKYLFVCIFLTYLSLIKSKLQSC